MMARRIQTPIIAFAVGDDSHWDKSDEFLGECAVAAGVSLDPSQYDAIRKALLFFLSEANLERHQPPAGETLRIASSLASNAKRLRKQLEGLMDDYSTNWVSFSHVGYPLRSYNELVRALGVFEIKAQETESYLAGNAREGEGRKKRPGLEQFVLRIEEILNSSGVVATANYDIQTQSTTSPFVKFVASLIVGMPKEVNPGVNGLGDAVKRILERRNLGGKT